MNEKRANIGRAGILQIPQETTGFPAGNPPHDPLPGAASGRPLSLAWITDDLLRHTREVWSRAYGRPVSEDEATEMLLNVKRLAEVMLKAAGQKGCVQE
jgi:hypothetical protein